MDDSNSVHTEPTRSVLDRLHDEARGDRIRFLTLVPRIAAGFVRRKTFSESVSPEATRDCFIPVSREQGELLYVTARAIGATNVVEFGTSFGISTIYLAAAVRDNVPAADGAGIVVGTEIEPTKRSRAMRHLAEAGLADYADVREGDALETLREVREPVDLVLLDGAKDLYLPVLELLLPRLRRGAVVFADNIFTFRKALRPYVERMQAPDSGFASTTVPVGHGFEYSVRLGV